MTELTLFVSTFILVFALGAQSLNVNNGHYIAAAVTSFVIGAGQMVLFKIAPHASGWSFWHHGINVGAPAPGEICTKAGSVASAHE